MNLDSKFLNKILANKFLQCIRRIGYHNKIGFIQNIQVWFNIGKSIRVYHINRRKEKKVIISKDPAEAFGKFSIKSILGYKQGIECNFLNLTDCI